MSDPVVCNRCARPAAYAGTGAFAGIYLCREHWLEPFTRGGTVSDQREDEIRARLAEIDTRPYIEAEEDVPYLLSALERERERAESAEANVEAMRNDSSKNKAYREVAEMASALAHLFPSWVNVDPNEPEWPVLYAQLPSGQVSWHFSPDDLDLIGDIPRGGAPWDGHTREERSARLRALLPESTEEGTRG